ncbi:hypothetical protein GpartN1_g3371.t1 [Galdieria partita]|uniref:Uncharacterized protein n=1 Tax=Galdieria partita TaxID=83374 RepID=A0A9C7PWB5_9RHOD|nr:hypothetical protein GpartN1_g3371.t1 [Galdieria partita]
MNATTDHPYPLWKQLVDKHLSKKRNENFRLLLQLFQSTPKLSWSRYFEVDPRADSFIQQGLYSQDLWLCSASLEYLKLLFEYVGRRKQEEPALLRTCVRVGKLLVTVHLERMEFLVRTARQWRFEQRGFAHQVAALWRAIFGTDEMIVSLWMSKMVSIQSPILIQMVKSSHHHNETLMHEWIFLWKMGNKVANTKELEYFYGNESLFIRKVLQHITHCQDKYWILQVLKTLKHQHEQRWKHARVRIIRKGLSVSFIQTVALWSVADICEEPLAHPLDNEEIRQLCKEWIYSFIGRVPYWIETEELVEMTIRLSFHHISHFRLVEQLLEWRPSLSSPYLLQCHFHKMDPEPSPVWLFQALALIKALDTDDSIPLPNLSTSEESAKAYLEYCMHIWPLESKDSCLERVLLHTDHLLCPWIGLQILLHILNRLERYLNATRKDVTIDEQWIEDIQCEVIVGRLPNFQVVWAVVRRALKQQHSVISMESMQWMEYLKTFHSLFYYVPLEPQHMNMELLTLGLQVIAYYRKFIPWLEKEQRWDISKIFFAFSAKDFTLEYHWILPYLQYRHLMNAVLNNIHTSLHDGNHFRLLIASQQGPRRFSRLGQLLYLYSLYTQRSKVFDEESKMTFYLLYECIWEIGIASGCFDHFELHFWLFWLSFACEEQPELEKAIFQEHCIGWFEQLWIELWRKPFLIWDMKEKEEDDQRTRKRKERSSSHVQYLITLAMIRKLANPKSEEEQPVRRWFVIGVAYFIRLQCFEDSLKEKWFKERLKNSLKNINGNEELLWLYEQLSEKGQEENKHSPLSTLLEIWNQWSLEKQPIALIDWKELEQPVIAEEWKRSFLEPISWTPSHRLVILQTLLWQWNIQRGSNCFHTTQHFHHDTVTMHVLELLYEIMQRISQESLQDYVNLLWNQSIWNQWLKHSFDFFVYFTGYWTCVVKKWKYFRRLDSCLERCMPSLLYWSTKECSDTFLVQQWLELLSWDQWVRLLERLLSHWVGICASSSSSTCHEKRISNIVDKLIVVFQKGSHHDEIKCPLSDTLKQRMEWIWNEIICRRDRNSALHRKYGERLWSVMLSLGWLSLHIWLGMVMQKHRSHLMHLMLELQQFKDTQHKEWRKQWIDWMMRRYPKIVGKWLRWIHHKRKQLRKKKRTIHSVASIVLLLKPSLEWKVKNKWIATLLNLLYRSLWYERKTSNMVWLEEYDSSKEWIQMAVQSIASSKSCIRRMSHWKRMAWRWVKHLFRKQSLWNKEGKLKKHQMKCFLLGFDTLDILVSLSEDSQAEQKECLFDMMTCLLDWNTRRRISLLDDPSSSMFVAKYIDILWKLFYNCMGDPLPHCWRQDHRVVISYHNDIIIRQITHGKLSSDQCLQWLQSILSCLQSWTSENRQCNDHPTHSSMDSTKLGGLITIGKHILLWYHLHQQQHNKEKLDVQYNEWINHWIQWTIHVLCNTDWENLKFYLLSFIQWLLALILSDQWNMENQSESLLWLRDDSNCCISFHGNICVDSQLWTLLLEPFKSQTMESSIDWMNKGHVEHSIMVIWLIISGYRWIGESNALDLTWLKQSCLSILHQLDSQRVLQTIEYLLCKRKRNETMMCNNILYNLSDKSLVVEYLIQNNMMEQMDDYPQQPHEKEISQHSIQSEKDNRLLLDPGLLLSLIFQELKVAQRDTATMMDRIQWLTNQHWVEFCMACLSVKNEHIQCMSRACLEYLLDILSSPCHRKYYPEAQSMTVFLTLLKNNTTELPMDSFWIRLSIQLWEIFCQPTHVLYMPLVKTCLDWGIAWSVEFFRALSKYVEDEERRTTSDRQSLPIQYREWCLSLLSRVETWQDFEKIRRIEIFEDCWRLVFGHAVAERKNQLFCQQGLIMLSKVVHGGEAQLVVDMDKCWGIISGMNDMLCKKYPNGCYRLMDIYISMMEKCNMEMSPFAWLIGISLWKEFVSQWEQNQISFAAGRCILLRCLQIFKKCPWDIFSGLRNEWSPLWLQKLKKEPFLQWEYSRWLWDIRDGEESQNVAILCRLHWQQLLMETRQLAPSTSENQNDENMDHPHDIWYQYSRITL